MKRAARRKTSSSPSATHRSGPRKTIFELPPLELECMKVLWARGEATVRDIREQLAADSRPLAYTTVETIMDRLTRKGAVVRQRVGRAHRYTPVYQKAEARAQALAAVADHFFDGSRAALVAHLNGSSAATRTAREATPVVKRPVESPARRPALEPVADAAIDTSLL